MGVLSSEEESFKESSEITPGSNPYFLT